MKRYYVYILASKRNGTLYIGITSNLLKRVSQHKVKAIKGFTAKHGVDKLVYYEEHQYVHDAIHRENRVKEWKREWKLELIEQRNPEWRDLYLEIIM